MRTRLRGWPRGLPPLSKCVLIADDQAEVREWVADILRELGRATVETGRADQVLPLIQEMGDALSMVLLDLDFGQGQMGGMDALRQVREAGCQIPVVILTGRLQFNACPLRQFLQRLIKTQPFIEHQKTDDIATLSAAKTVVHLAVTTHHKRRCLFVGKRTQRLVTVCSERL